MAEYKGIHGTKIQNYTSDPDNPITGQVWYNETSQTMKFQYPTTVSAWSTGGNLNTARFGMACSAGTQNSGLVAGGDNPPSVPEYFDFTETYNGTSWTEVNNLTTARRESSSGGTQTSALSAGGSNGTGVLAITETWNGTSWTEVNDLNNARGGIAGAYDDNTAGLAIAGAVAATDNTETWNGTSWTAASNYPIQVRNLAGAGNETAALAFGGDIPPGASTTDTFSYNGSSWTDIADLNTGRTRIAGAGTQTLALAFGGEVPPFTGATEIWNGSVWTETTDLSTARRGTGGLGTQSSALAAGGAPAPTTTTTATEEWNTGIPVGAWSTGGAMITHRDGAGAGIQTAGLIFGGNNPGAGSYDKTELYNGASWTELAATLNSARSSSGGTGTSTSALMFAGYDNGGPLAPLSYVGFTESYNGSAWTEVGDLNTGRQIVGSAGIDNTSALCFGGLTNPGAYGTQTETWNGTSWTEVNNLNTGRYSQGDGTQTSAINAGGYNGSNVANTETWNGTSWTEVNDLNTARRGLGASGTDNTSALFYGGFSTVNTGATEEWNGTSFTEVNDLSAAGGGSRNIGTESLALRVSPAPVGSVEEWTKPSFTTKTITSS